MRQHLFALVLSACVALPACVHSDHAEALLIPSDFSPKAEVLQAAPSELIMTQEFVPTSVATLDSAETIEVQEGMGRKHTFRPGLRFFEAKSSYFPMQIFCASENTYGGGIGWLPSRTCLVDTDFDGKFDTTTVMFPSDVKLNIDGGNLTVPGDIKEPIPYSISKTTDQPSVQLGIEIDKLLFSNISLHLVGLDEDQRTVKVSDWYFEVPNKESLPTVIDVAGARIEVIAVKENNLTYRVLSGFPPEQILRLVGTYSF